MRGATYLGSIHTVRPWPGGQEGWVSLSSPVLDRRRPRERGKEMVAGAGVLELEGTLEQGALLLVGH